MSSFYNCISTYSKEGSLIVGYGVPTKATLLLKISNLTNREVSFIVEDNPLKIGKFLPGTSIPIHPVDKLISSHPDVIIILAWNFSEDIIDKLRLILKSPAKCIIPLPHLKEVLI